MNTFRHSGSYGDMIFGLPTVIALGGGTYYLRNDQAASIGRLFAAQPYIQTQLVDDMSSWKALTPTHDLDKFRAMSEPHVARMHLKAFDVDFNFSKPYLFNIEPKRIARIAVQDTGRQRFPGATVNWELLRPHLDECVFIGSDRDYELFVEDRNMPIKRHKCDDIYEFAQVIAGCDLFVGNMSIGQTIAEGLKKPYVVDLYIGRPQYPLWEHGHAGLGPEVLYWYLRIPYPGIPKFAPDSHD